MINYRSICSDEWFTLVDSSSPANKFKSAEPFPNFFLGSFFTESFCSQLLNEFPKFEDGDCLNELGLPGNKSSNTNFKSIGDAYRQLDTLISSELFLNDLSKVTGFPGLQYDPTYFGGGTHENRNFQNMASHVDYNYHPITKKHRRINIIIYLNEVWSTTWGGNLQLHSNPWNPSEDRITNLGCLLNNAVIFETSERSWHGFSEVLIPNDSRINSRKSIALYFYTDDRPIEETAPSHGTVYVESPLPRETYDAHSLNFETYNLINKLIGRRNSYLKYLHERDVNFSKDISSRLVLDWRNYPYKDYIKIVSEYLQSENDLMFAYYEKEKMHSRLKNFLANSFVEKSPISKFFWGPIISMDNFNGLYEDGWAGEQVSADNLLFETSINHLRIRLNYFSNGMKKTEIIVRLNDQSNNLGELHDGVNVLDLRFENLHQISQFRINATDYFVPNLIDGKGDIRHLSYLIDSIEFKEAL